MVWQLPTLLATPTILLLVSAESASCLCAQLGRRVPLGTLYLMVLLYHMLLKLFQNKKEAARF
jgi:hypothetical protein